VHDERATDAPDVRAARDGDAAAIAPLLAELGYPATTDAVRARLRRIAAYSGPVAVLVASLGGDVMGVITAHAFPSIHHDAPAAWITALVVASAARGRGVGRRLVRAVEEWAAEQGAVRVSVTSGIQRADAHRFYEGLGYATSGRRFTRPLETRDGEAR